MSTPTKTKCPKCGADAQRTCDSADPEFSYRCPRCGFGFTPEPEPMVIKPISEIFGGQCRAEYSRAELTDKAEEWVKANFEERTQEYYKTLGILIHFISDHFPK